MLYSISTSPLPAIHEMYYIRRKTVWTQAYSNHTLVIVVDGSCQFTIEKDIYVLNKGDILYIPVGIVCTRNPVNEQQCEMYYIHFMSTSVTSHDSIDEIRLQFLNIRENSIERLFDFEKGEFLSDNRIYFGEITHLDKQYDTVSRLTSIAYSSIHHNNLTQPYILTFYLFQVLCLASEVFIANLLKDSIELPDEKTPKQLISIISFIRCNIHNKITLQDLSKHSNFSPQYIIRLFKQYIGKTPTEYINQLKISFAKEFIRTTNWNMKEISGRCGFENPHYFSRLFKQIEGIYPTEFKDKFLRTYETPNNTLDNESISEEMIPD